ncbi:MAG: DUF4342 domain-containing protein [Bacillota bacterium]|nr:DUF4342 domain-containing protein [Bacillota bacterium]
MERLEMVERLKAKAGVTYEEAKNALEESNWDLLQAMIDLENKGKFKNQEKTEGKKMENTKKAFDTKAAESWLVKAGNWIKEIVDKGNRNHIIVTKDKRQALEIPVTMAVLLLIFLHGLTLFALFISVLMGYRYSFRSEKENMEQKQQIKDADRAAEEINDHHTVNSFNEG